MCVCWVSFFLWRRSCVFFLSSCWVWGSCCWASSGMAAVPFPGAPAVFRSVSCSWLPFSGSAPIWLRLAGLLLQWTFIVGLAVSWYTTWFSTLCQRSFPVRCLSLAGSATFLAPVCWSTPAVEPCCWVGGVLIHHLVFYLVPAQLPLPLLPLSGCCNLSGSSLLVYSCGGALLLGWRCFCCVTWFSTMCCALPPGPTACAAYPAAGSFGDFQVTGCLSFCFPGDVGWASALPFFFCASPAPTGLQGLAGFCTLCQGCSSWGGVCSLDDGVVTLLAFPYLRVGELLDCGVSGVSWLRSLRSRLPFVVRSPFHVSGCPSPSLGLGWFGHRSVTPPAAPGFWTLLELGCAILTP